MRSVTPSRYGADDWIRTSIIRFTKPAPCSFGHVGKARAQGIEPCRSVLEADCSPRSTLV